MDLFAGIQGLAHLFQIAESIIYRRDISGVEAVDAVTQTEFYASKVTTSGDFHQATEFYYSGEKLSEEALSTLATALSSAPDHVAFKDDVANLSELKTEPLSIDGNALGFEALEGPMMVVYLVVDDSEASFDFVLHDDWSDNLFS